MFSCGPPKNGVKSGKHCPLFTVSSSSLISSFALWSYYVYHATDFKHFISTVSILLSCSLIKVQFSYPYSSNGTAITSYDFKNVSLLLVLNVCQIAPYVY